MFLRKLHLLVALLTITSSNLFSATRPSMAARLANSNAGTLCAGGALTAVGAYALYRALKVTGATTKETALNTAKRWGLLAVSTTATAAALQLLRNNKTLSSLTPTAQQIATLGTGRIANTVITLLSLRIIRHARGSSSLNS